MDRSPIGSALFWNGWKRADSSMAATWKSPTVPPRVTRNGFRRWRPHQVGRQRRKPFRVTLGGTVGDFQVAAIDESALFQPFQKSAEPIGDRSIGTALDDADLAVSRYMRL